MRHTPALLAAALVCLTSLPAAADDWWLECEQGGKRILLQEKDGKPVVREAGAVVQRGAVPSPDGKRLAYVSTKDGDAEIWVSDADGKNARQLTDNTAIDNHPQWSPDGAWIFFGSTRGGTWQIWRMKADGSEPEALTAHEVGAWHPRVSPVGRKLSCLLRRPAAGAKLPPSDLLAIDLETRRREVVLSNVQLLDHAWDPAGKRIAASLSGSVAIVEPGSTERPAFLYLDKLEPRFHAHGAGNLVWRPDGKRIACTIHFLGGRMVGTKVYGDDEVFFLTPEGKLSALTLPVPARPLRWVKSEG